MKKSIFLSLFLCLSICSFSQDIIITKDNERIDAKVLEITETDVKYVLFYYQDGPTYLIYKSNVKTIAYENGLVENFDNENNENIEQSNTEVEEQKTEKIFKNVIRFNPFATIQMAILTGAFDINLQYARYLTNKIAIPVELEVFYGNRAGAGFTLMSGIEAIPATHRQKSGLFLQALTGVVMVYGDIGFAANANVGYQLMTRKGFVFNVALGPMYETISDKLNLRLLLGVGFAF